MESKREVYQAASYSRLSREDGDKLESDSIVNQQRLIEDYCSGRGEFRIVDVYADDGFTGTNFNRPAFQRMIRDIASGKVNCVIVKDLSRFGRDYIDMGFYLERFFPEKMVRFIAINDHVDSHFGAYDMMLPLKNVFNTQYARDISEKVRSAFKAKQRRGEFIGAFAPYGYMKDPSDHNHLIIDPVAAKVVLQIFQMAADGYGQIRIARYLNEESIPCPSLYKKLNGEKYTNNHRLDATTYWTYATIHRILKNEMYRGNMVQSTSVRPTMHGKAKKAADDEVIIVHGTHDAIVSDELWNSVQALVSKNTKAPDFDSHVSHFAGLVKCGDCGRAMCRKTSNGCAQYCCGSYERYGPSVCSRHPIREDRLKSIILNDLNHVIRAVPDLKRLADENSEKSFDNKQLEAEKERLNGAFHRIRRLKKNLYEDFRADLLSREEYLRYKADYDEQEQIILMQIRRLEDDSSNTEEKNEWINQLVELGALRDLDRCTIAQTVEEIRVYEDRKVEIRYLFSEELRFLLEAEEKPEKVSADASFV